MNVAKWVNDSGLRLLLPRERGEGTRQQGGEREILSESPVLSSRKLRRSLWQQTGTAADESGSWAQDWSFGQAF